MAVAWECGECHAILQAKRTLTRHWKIAQEAGRGHQGDCIMIVRPGPLPASSAPPLSRLPSPSPPPSPSSPPPPTIRRFSPPASAAPAQSIRTQEVERGALRTRTTRNQDHQGASRNRPGVVDLDPTEGLPVQKWEQTTVRINQDPSSEPTAPTGLPSGATTTSSAEWAAQFNTPQFPWSERPLPSFFSQLPLMNQELIRRARAGNTNAKVSVWDGKTNSWISSAEAEKRNNPLKSVHLNNLDHSNGSNKEVAAESPAHDDDEDHDEKSEDEIDVDNADDDVGRTKRRKRYVPEERTFEVKRWTLAPSSAADRVEERKFLADRRPGMRSYYGNPYQNEVFGSLGLNTNGFGSSANAGYDLGDGGGLGNAATVLGAAEGNAAPVRKNMPPKRKKKKGGPGRKKANPLPQTDNNGVQGATTSTIQTTDGNIQPQQGEDSIMVEGENEGSDSGSEGEGSEEGEIDEGGHDQEKQADIKGIQTESQANLQSEQPVTTANEDQIVPDEMQSSTITTDADVTKAVSDASNIGLALDGTFDSNTAPADIEMQDQPTAPTEPSIEASVIEQPEPEVIPSIIPPPISEQLPDPAPLQPEPQSLPMPTPQEEMIPNVPQQELPVEEVPQPDLQTQPINPTSDTQPTTSEPSTYHESTTLPIPSLDPIPVNPTTQLPPISTTIAEAMDQASISAPGIDPTPDPAVIAAPPPAAVPEPTSPDLLGGLEDALNKGMDDQES